MKNTKVLKKLRKLAKSLDRQRDKLLPKVVKYLSTLDDMAVLSDKIKEDKELKDYLVSVYKHDIGQSCYEFLEDLEYGTGGSDFIEETLSDDPAEIITIIKD